MVHANLTVGVSYGDVECDIVVESCVGVGVGVGDEIEFSEGGIGDSECELMGKKYQPKDEDKDGEDKEEGRSIDHEPEVTHGAPVPAVLASKHDENEGAK